MPPISLNRRSFISALSVSTLSTAGCVEIDTDPERTWTPDRDRLRWRRWVNGRAASSPALHDGTLYIGSFDGALRALDPGDGSIRWTYETDGEIWSSPAVTDTAVYVGSKDSNLHCLGHDGSEKWRFETEGSIWGGCPAVHRNSVYVGSEDGVVYAIDAGTGTEQ